MTGRQGRKREIRMELTPMIDVVFLLLVFFMCTLEFKTFEGKLAAYLPAEKGVDPFPDLEPEEPIRLKLSMRGDRCICFVNGRGLGTLPEAGPRLFDRLQALRAALQESPAEIDADPAVPCRFVVNVMDECLRARVEKINFTGALPALR